MYAVIKTGGKQYKVAKDQIVTVEKLAGTAGDNVAFDQVLMVGEADQTTLGAPFVAGASVVAEVLEQGRADKIVVFKKKRRKNYRRRHGHRQDETVLRITEILTDGKKPSKAAAKPAPVKTETKAAEKPADTKAEAKPAAKQTEKKAEAKPEAKKPAAKTAAKKAPAKSAQKAAAEKAPAKKAAAKRAPAKKAPAKKKS